jgi:hypothetical protein
MFHPPIIPTGVCIDVFLPKNQKVPVRLPQKRDKAITDSVSATPSPMVSYPLFGDEKVYPLYIALKDKKIISIVQK